MDAIMSDVTWSPTGSRSSHINRRFVSVWVNDFTSTDKAWGWPVRLGSYGMSLYGGKKGESLYGYEDTMELAQHAGMVALLEVENSE
ncbi:hypothetical protein LCGC14_1299540 [marine sediment metagenome]|uniref:Uncharacterized protein n=1 Tax=marine sediment metagenome TaxID=412755 RepID=A0A0F9KRL6_9ZZZZ